MKKSIVLLVIVTLMVSFSFGQEFNLPQKGNKALLFEFSGLGFLGVLEYQGGFGYKMFLNDNMGLRTALLLNYTKDNIPYTGGDGEDGYDKTFGFGAEIALEFHKHYGKVSPYSGIGGQFFRTTTEIANPVAQGVTQQTLKNQLGGNAGMLVGGYLIMGMEYFLTEHLSLSGEYRFGVEHISALTEEYDNGTTVVETEGGSSLRFGIVSSALFTLAIYR